MEAEEVLLEFKCSGCSYREYTTDLLTDDEIAKMCDTELERSKPKSIHFGVKVGVGNFRCGALLIDKIWKRVR